MSTTKVSYFVVLMCYVDSKAYFGVFQNTSYLKIWKIWIRITKIRLAKSKIQSYVALTGKKQIKAWGTKDNLGMILLIKYLIFKGVIETTKPSVIQIKTLRIRCHKTTYHVNYIESNQSALRAGEISTHLQVLGSTLSSKILNEKSSC